MTLKAVVSSSGGGGGGGSTGPAGPTGAAGATGPTGSAGSAVAQIVGGTGISISPTGGTGTVTVAAGPVPWIGNKFPFVRPAFGDLSWANQNGWVATDNGGGGPLTITRSQGTSGDNITSLELTPPAPPYTYEALITQQSPPQKFNSVGLILRNSGSGKLITFDISSRDDTQGGTATPALYGIEVARWTNATTYASNAYPTSGNAYINYPNFGWYKIVNDGVNITYYFSIDGYDYWTVLQEANNAYMTIDRIGFGGSSACVTTLIANYQLAVKLWHWKQS